MMKAENFLLQKEKNVAKVVVNRPEQRNAFKTTMWFELIDIFKEMGEDPEIRVVVITGAGNKSFVAGADISEMEGEFPPVVNEEMVNPGALATRVVQDSEKVVIAMINGYAIGGGCELAMACDLRVAADSAGIRRICSADPAARRSETVSPRWARKSPLCEHY